MFYFMAPAVFLTLRKFGTVILIMRSGSTWNLSSKGESELADAWNSTLQNDRRGSNGTLDLSLTQVSAVNKKLHSFKLIQLLINWHQVWILLQNAAAVTQIAYLQKLLSL